jgi:hypothetical protein
MKVPSTHAGVTRTRPPEAGVVSSTALVTMSLAAGAQFSLHSSLLKVGMTVPDSFIHSSTSKGACRKT